MIDSVLHKVSADKFFIWIHSDRNDFIDDPKKHAGRQDTLNWIKIISCVDLIK